jgi:DNA replication protein DnaC
VTYKHWAQIFNNDRTLTPAILDPIMHHVDTIIIEGKRFRIEDEVEG